MCGSFLIRVEGTNAAAHTNPVSKPASRAQNDPKERQTLHDASTQSQKSNGSAKG